MSWHKVKVGDFLIRVKDLIPIEKDKEYSLVTIKLYHRGVQLRKKELGANISADKMSRVKEGQFILSGIDARNGAFGIVPPELDGAIVTNDFWHFDIDENIISKEYFLWLTTTPYFDDICKKASDGTTNRIRLQADRFYTQELLIPEIENQHDVVEGLKKQSDKISKIQNEYTFQLTQLDNLNQAILQEAMQGKLVSQDKKDESASELLKRIKAEKATLRQAQGKGKKEKSLPPIKPEEIPFEIPENWVWCRLGEMISISSGDGLTSYQMDKSGKIPVYGGNGINGYHSQFNIDSKRIVIGRVGAYCGVVHITENKAWITDNAFVVSYSQANIDFNWLSFFLKALDLNKLSYKGNQPVISGARVYPLAVSLPPLSEQKRIVAEIEKQFAKTRQLKEHIIANQQATEQLLKALLHQAFEVEEMVEENRKGK